ncbi:FGGY-family carbohydrate kinase [Paenibacillus sp. UNC499MF]|uniref:xylulokinase n=1 Tax=Paenibacillus sp. UNC499MF TaxID=1502751 RepID=UPI00089F8622|nr:FGGY family carbohydrate kinase [Paenibacillus sp. UNC499MF]SEF66670.1 xylulokinase [Paenibacillus sp. UNC499MF]
MTYIASFDIGTTHVKGILVSKDGELFHERNVPLTCRQEPPFIEQEPEQWFKAVGVIVSGWLGSGIDAGQIGLVALSGQMQDCIPVDGQGRAVRPAILYSDTRAGAEARLICREIGEEEIVRCTANGMDGTLTFPKLLWLKTHEPDTSARTSRYLISSKDYVIARLTGAFVTDPTSAATAGCMDIRRRVWREDWLVRMGLPAGKLPDILPSGETAGRVHAEGSRLTGLAEGTPVLCGIGDAGAATLGAGVYEPGEVYAYIGTTGWIAGVSGGVADPAAGLFNLAYAEPGRYIQVAPLTNAGNAHHWAAEVFGPEEADMDGQERYEAVERLVEASDRSRNMILFLPYLNGERCPVQDEEASGCFIGLRPSATKADMAAAVLEGVAFAMKQVMELQAEPGRAASLTLIGGGARSRQWCGILADVFGTEVSVPSESQFLPCLGAALLGFPGMGWESSYKRLCEQFKSKRNSETFSPNAAHKAHYESKYARYLKLYPALAPVFRQAAPEV